MIEESAHRDVCDALHRAIIERDRLRAEVERLRPGPAAVDLIAHLRSQVDPEEEWVFVDSAKMAAFLAEHDAGRTGEVLDAQHERLTRLKARKAADDRPGGVIGEWYTSRGMKVPPDAGK